MLMLAEDYPTAPLPTLAQGESAAVNDVITINPREDVLLQVRHYAAGRGHRIVEGFEGEKGDYTNIEGFSYEQGDMRYVVTGDVAHQVTEPTKKRRVLPSFSRQIGGAHTIEYETQPSEFIVLEGFKDDESVSRIRLKAADFASYLNEHVREGYVAPDRLIDIKSLRLETPERSQEGETETISIDLSDGKKPVLDAVMDTQEKERLPGLEGLSWTREGYPHRVVEDISRFLPTKQGQSIVSREFVIEVRNHAGQTINEYTLGIGQLHKHLQTMNTAPNRLPKDLRFEVPVDRAAPLEETFPSGAELSEDDAAAVLLFGDLYGGGDEAQRQAVDDLKNGANVHVYVKALQEMAKGFEPKQLRNLALMLRQYYKIIEKFGLGRARTLGEEGVHLILNHLAGQLQTPDNPLDDNLAVLQTRRDIVDMGVGFRYMNTAVHEEEVPVKKMVKIPEAERQPGGDEYKEVVVGQPVAALNESVVNFLQPFIKDEVAKILSKAEPTRQHPEGQRLNGGDWLKIGRLLGRVSNQRLLE